jgi:hypothetical protein
MEEYLSYFSQFKEVVPKIIYTTKSPDLQLKYVEFA